MIVCVCKAVSDRAIRRAVAEGHDTIDALQFELGVGINCGKCVSMACEVLCDARSGTHRAQPDRPTHATSPVPVFRALLVARSRVGVTGRKAVSGASATSQRSIK